MLGCATTILLRRTVDWYLIIMSDEYDDEEEGPPSHWGAEVKSDGKPVPYVPPPLDAKLHLSQVECACNLMPAS